VGSSQVSDLAVAVDGQVGVDRSSRRSSGDAVWTVRLRALLSEGTVHSPAVRVN
jgi:hypothetical protein